MFQMLPSFLGAGMSATSMPSSSGAFMKPKDLFGQEGLSKEPQEESDAHKAALQMLRSGQSPNYYNLTGV
jgi:hypothetical protein